MPNKTRKEKELTEFEILCSSLITKREDIRRIVKESRNSAWEESLIIVGGNEKRAVELFDNVYARYLSNYSEELP